MSERLIRFNHEMVRAYLDGRKTQHRLPMTPQPNDSVSECEWYNPTRGSGEEYPGRAVYGCYTEDDGWVSPFGAPGDRLWSREKWRPWHHVGGPNQREGSGILYAADNQSRDDSRAGEIWTIARANKWRPSTQMPRWASRITLVVKRVWVEWVQDITEAGAVAEGFERREHFIRAWDAIYAAMGYGFDDNPRVWACEFGRRENA